MFIERAWRAISDEEILDLEQTLVCTGPVERIRRFGVTGGRGDPRTGEAHSAKEWDEGRRGQKMGRAPAAVRAIGHSQTVESGGIPGRDAAAASIR